MSNWQLLAKNHLGNRAWSSVSAAWSAASIGFDLKQTQDISDAVGPILTPDFEKRANMSVFNFRGSRVAGFMDAATATAKSAYVLRSAGNCLLGGQPTWAAIDAYHFSFVAARALLAMLGVHLVHICDTFAILDIFPEGETDRERSLFRKQYPTLSDPCKLIFRSRSAPIEQRAIWTILLRLLRTTTFDVSMQSTVSRICELGEGFSGTRNDILYKNNSWLYDEDYTTPWLPEKINNEVSSQESAERFFGERDSSFAFATLMHSIVKALVDSIEKLGGTDIIPTSYGACFKRFESFNPDNLRALFSSVYRLECYGIAI